MWPFKSGKKADEPVQSLPGEPLLASTDPVNPAPPCPWRKGQFVVCDGHIGIFVRPILNVSEITDCVNSAVQFRRKFVLCADAEKMKELEAAILVARAAEDVNAVAELCEELHKGAFDQLYEVHKVDVKGETAIQAIVAGDQIIRTAKYLEIPESRRGDEAAANRRGYF